MMMAQEDLHGKVAPELWSPPLEGTVGQIASEMPRADLAPCPALTRRLRKELGLEPAPS